LERSHSGWRHPVPRTRRRSVTHSEHRSELSLCPAARRRLRCLPATGWSSRCATIQVVDRVLCRSHDRRCGAINVVDRRKLAFGISDSGACHGGRRSTLGAPRRRGGRAVARRAHRCPPRRPTRRHNVACGDPADGVRGGNQRSHEIEIAPDDDATIFYTSGTTVAQACWVPATSAPTS
jgi:hypothetical protein